MNSLVPRLCGYLTEQEKNNEHEKKSFWCSEAEKPVFDLYHEWLGTPPTNPPEPEKLIMFSAGKMMELAIVEKMQKAGLIQKLEDDKQARVEMEREGVPISGYIDALDNNNNPIEIKTFYGDYQARDLKSGKPKTSYLKQLAMYMDCLDRDDGTLLYMDRGLGTLYAFSLTRSSGTRFRCNEIEFDLLDTYKRWSRLYQKNVLPRIEPKSEYRYKTPVTEINWSRVSRSDISKARNNQKVIGDGWQVAYSAYKDLIIEREGSCLGYSADELVYIHKATNGYSSKLTSKTKIL
jgi:hypothetical protein